MESALKITLYLISLVALITGINAVIGGAASVPGSLGPVEATVDNELRFFAVYWVAYGSFCFWVARNMRTQVSFIPFIALFFFLGGIGRLISIFAIGSPSAVLVSAMILELLLPIAMCFFYVKHKALLKH